MLDKIVLSKDRKTAVVVFDNKSFTLYHSVGKVMDLIEEIIIQPAELQERCDEITAVINLEDLKEAI
jgi:hypothetical protein